ncbi:MAG TPA: hypothetical protein VII56_04870 [Rhizomicrobium sp.]
MPFDMNIPPGLANCAPAWGRLKLAHDNIWQRLFLFDDALELDLVSAAGAQLGSFKAGEYKFKYGRITWSLVNAVPANGGVGATESLPKNMKDFKKWSGANTRILPGGLLGYDAWSEQGLNFLALHETAHTMGIGMVMTNDCWRDHLDREDGIPYGMGSAAWERNERFANDIALRMAEALQVKILGKANPGFDLSDQVAADGTTPPLTPADIPLHHLDLNHPATSAPK